MKHTFHSGVMFGRRVVTPESSFRLHEANRVHSRNIMKHIILGKKMENGEISDSTFLRTECLRHCDIAFMTPENFIFCITIPNVYDEVHSIRFRDVVTTFFLYLPWNCIFMLLLWLMVFGKFQFRGDVLY